MIRRLKFWFHFNQSDSFWQTGIDKAQSPEKYTSDLERFEFSSTFVKIHNATNLRYFIGIYFNSLNSLFKEEICDGGLNRGDFSRPKFWNVLRNFNRVALLNFVWQILITFLIILPKINSQNLWPLSRSYDII